KEDGYLRADRMGEQLESLAELEDLAFEAQWLAAHDLAHDLDGLAHPLQWPVEWDAVPAGHHLVTAGAEPEDEATARQRIEGGRGLAEQRRRPAEDVEDSRPQLDAIGARGQGAQHRDRIRTPGLRHPDRVIAAGL